MNTMKAVLLDGQMKLLEHQRILKKLGYFEG